MSNEIRKNRILGMFMVFAMLLAGFMLCGRARAEEETVDNGLPVVYINIDESKGTIAAMNESEDHSVRCYGSVDILNTGDEDYENLELSFIRGRGNSTWTFDKKPYAMKFEKSVDLLRMGKNKNWVLLANRLDPTMMNNSIALYMAEEFGMEYTPKGVPVDVVMNGEYLGSYLLAGQVRVGKTRVDIDELEQEDNDPEDITGGYLLAVGGQKEELPEKMINTENEMVFVCESPEFENGEYENEAQKEYITNYIQNLENAIMSDAENDFSERTYTDFLDVDSAVDYWLLQEFMRNPDAFSTGSTYLYKKRGGKLFYGPLWDLDAAFSLDLPLDSIGNTLINVWYERLFTDPEFAGRVKERWSELGSVVDGVVEENGMLDQYAARIKQSWIADYNLWGIYTLKAFGGNYNDGETGSEDDRSPEEIFDEYVEKLRSQLIARKNYIDENVDFIDRLIVTVKFMDGDSRLAKLYINNGSTIHGLPEAEEKSGLYFRGWFDENGEKIDENSVFTQNTVCTAVYVDEDLVSKAQVIYFRQNEIWLSTAAYEYETPYTLLPADAEDRRIKWESSDENVATVDKEGKVLLVGVGKAVITATLSNGEKFSYVLNVFEDEYSDDVKNIEKIVTDPESMLLEVGEYGNIDVSFQPFNADSNLVFESENPVIAEVDENGVVRGAADGETYIVVSDTFSEKSVKVLVKVGKKEDNEEDSSDDSQKATAEKADPVSPATGDGGTVLFAVAAMLSLCLAALVKYRKEQDEL